MRLGERERARESESEREEERERETEREGDGRKSNLKWLPTANSSAHEMSAKKKLLCR